MNTILSIFLMAPKQGENPLVSLLPLVALIGVFYFFMIRPQMKKQKELKKFRAELKKGDKVITLGGMYGKIIEINDLTVFLEIDTNVKIKVDKSALIIDPSDLSQQK